MVAKQSSVKMRREIKTKANVQFPVSMLSVAFAANNAEFVPKLVFELSLVVSLRYPESKPADSPDMMQHRIHLQYFE
jgi:hypothetical protein